MATKHGNAVNFFRDLLAVASSPGRVAEDLLCLALDWAYSVAEATTAGGVFLLESSRFGQKIMACALRGRSAEQRDEILAAWHRQVDGVVFMSANGNGESIRLERLLPESRSLLFVPILEGRRALGGIHLESTLPGYYTDQHRRLLQEITISVRQTVYRHLLTQRIQETGFTGEIIGTSTAFLDLENQIQAAARHRSCSVMIEGERGTGKELTARAIHCLSSRWLKPFVPVLSSALSPELFAAELFGHEEGAFTGAKNKREGKFMAAAGGTIFLDEVADLSSNVQSGLLRVIERGELARIGRDQSLTVDVRIIVATNRDLKQLMNKGTFRRDLFDRLCAFEIRVPSLRERRDDILALANYFLRKHCGEVCRRQTFGLGTECAACLTSDAVGCTTREFQAALEVYDWPGNIRELENVIIRSLASYPDETLDTFNLPHKVRRRAPAAPTVRSCEMALRAVVKSHIEEVLYVSGFNQSQAARMLGIPLSTMRSKITKLGIELKKP